MHTEKLKTFIANVVDTAEVCKNTYFWKPGANASSRRRNEQCYSIEPVSFEFAGDTWTLGFEYSESCSNVYASGHYYCNDKKTTLTAVKNLLKKVELVYEREKQVLESLRIVKTDEGFSAQKLDSHYSDSCNPKGEWFEYWTELKSYKTFNSALKRVLKEASCHFPKGYDLSSLEAAFKVQ